MTIIQPQADNGGILQPFGHAAPIYRAKGWLGTLPFRERTKFPPPPGFTGGNGHYPDEAQIERWLCDKYRRSGNIGLWAGPIEIDGKLYELLGIDVDHYGEKRGGDSLAELEKKLGKLPLALISSARADGISGIRWFLVPAGLRWFESLAGDGIELVWSGCHYGIVWPSIHPDEGIDPAVGIYLWYRRGDKPDGSGDGNIPYAAMLPILPDAWVDHLTNGRMLRVQQRADLTSRKGELYEWADKTFPDGSAEAMCPAMAAARDQWIDRIKSDPTSHDKVRDGQWRIINLAAEGHFGWVAACNELEEFWADNVMERDKRRLGVMVREIVSARTGALQKVKPDIQADIESAERIGAIYYPAECLCSLAYQYPGREALAEWNRNMAKQRKPEDDGLAEDEEWFWDSRPWLRDLRQFARSRRVSPWGMLGCVLVRILSTVPPEVVLPPLVGSYATVNTFVAICGDPATSKSALMKAAEDFIILKNVNVPTYNPGSAEAIPKSFAYIEPGVKATKATKTQPAQPAQPPRQVGLAWSVLFAIPEVETLLEQANGKQILAALRSIWSGETFGKRYAGEPHNICIMPHRSRCNVILGVQWDFGEFFFKAVGVGTPQRIIYLPARDTEQVKVKPQCPDPTMLDAWPTDDGSKPAQLNLDARNVYLADQLNKPQDDFTVFEIPDITRDEVDNHAMFRSGPEEFDTTDPLDGHLLLAQEKIAVAFAVMDGTYEEFNAEHWKLSGVVIRKSKQTRRILYRKVDEDRARKRDRQARWAGISRHRAELAFNEQQERGIARVAKLIYNKLDKSEWSARTDIKHAIPNRDRVFFDPAIEELGERIETEERPNAKGRSTTYYRRAT